MLRTMNVHTFISKSILKYILHFLSMNNAMGKLQGLGRGIVCKEYSKASINYSREKYSREKSSVCTW